MVIHCKQLIIIFARDIRACIPRHTQRRRNYEIQITLDYFIINLFSLLCTMLNPDLPARLCIYNISVSEVLENFCLFVNTNKKR